MYIGKKIKSTDQYNKYKHSHTRSPFSFDADWKQIISYRGWFVSVNRWVKQNAADELSSQFRKLIYWS